MGDESNFHRKSVDETYFNRVVYESSKTHKHVKLENINSESTEILEIAFFINFLYLVGRLSCHVSGTMS